jgi:hypothetical protein
MNRPGVIAALMAPAFVGSKVEQSDRLKRIGVIMGFASA